MPAFNILLADDHQLILDGLVRILSGVEGVAHIATVNSAPEALQHPQLATADLLITDVEMPGMSGIELLRKVKELYPQKKVMVLTMHNDAALAKELIKLNADGYMLKSANEKEMQFAVASVLSGKKFFSHDVTLNLATAVASAPETAKLASLTQREKEILGLVAQGFSNKQIADKLFVSVKTIDTHRTNLMSKLDIHNAAGLTRFAIQHKLL